MTTQLPGHPSAHPNEDRAVRHLHHDAGDRPMIVIWETTRACQLVCKHCRAVPGSAHRPCAGAHSCRHCVRTWKSTICAATSTRVWRSWSGAITPPSFWPWPGWNGSVWTGTSVHDCVHRTGCRRRGRRHWRSNAGMTMPWP